MIDTLYFRIGPEKGVIHIASGAVNNAVWDMYARSRMKPLWKLVVDFTPVRMFNPNPSFLTNFFFLKEELVRSASFRYISDAITKEEALAMVKEKAAGKKEREGKVCELGYPAYVTSAGWLGQLPSTQHLLAF